MSLLLGIGFCLYTLAAGYGLLRLGSMPAGLSTLALAAPAGLAVLAVLTTWSTSAGLAAPATTILAVSPVVYGLLLVARQRLVRPAWWQRDSKSALGFTVLLAAVALASVLLGVGFAGVDAPLSTHDGAFHVETIDAARQGTYIAGWYPSGLHTAIAAYLGLVPWVDTAQGAFGASLGLGLLALVALFGLGYVVWRNAVIAGAGAVALALTFQFPYHAHFWGGWPLTAAIVIVLGVWTVAIAYLRQASARLATIAGLLAAGIVLIHGTEIYTVAIGLLALLAAARWRELRLQPLVVHVLLAVIVGGVLAAPYLSTVFHWAAAGGASAVGGLEAQGEALSSGDTAAENLVILIFNTFGTGVGVDLPFRLGLVLVGAWQTWRWRTGPIVVALGALFLGLALAFAGIHLPLLEAVYSATFPWAQAYRLLMIAALAAALLQGLGAVVLVRAWARNRSRWSGTHLQRLPRILAVVALLLLAGSAVSMALLLSANARVYASTSTDDTAAMAWLRANARPGEVVANDRFADAGIWAPFKAGTPIVMPRSRVDHLDERELVSDTLGRADASPESQAAACALNVRYLFHGSTATLWEARHFPPLADLRRSPALEEVFASGAAVVFRTRLHCAE